MSLTPNHRERQFMQRLRGRGWVKAIELPNAGMTLKRLFEKRWVETQRVGAEVSYRITDEGLAAKTALIPIRR
jgi:DNA-binding PadR family transcriptional regulator